MSKGQQGSYRIQVDVDDLTASALTYELMDGPQSYGRKCLPRDVSRGRKKTTAGKGDPAGAGHDHVEETKKIDNDAGAGLAAMSLRKTTSERRQSMFEVGPKPPIFPEPDGPQVLER
ncbi:hypothetical protein BGW39_003376 [Mortierella sp. 14UC]|nr:hypothetical protein BGW39_003376 [Mortierella sp. 14UC]